MPQSNRFQTVLEAVKRAGGGTWSEGITRAAIRAAQRYDLENSHFVDDNEKFWSPDFKDETALAFIRRILENACVRVEQFHKVEHEAASTFNQDIVDIPCSCNEIEGIILGILIPKEDEP